MNESSYCSSSLPVLGVSVLDFGHSDKCEWYLTVALICISLMTNDMEYFFIWLFGISMSSIIFILEKNSMMTRKGLI